MSRPKRWEIDSQVTRGIGRIREEDVLKAVVCAADQPISADTAVKTGKLRSFSADKIITEPWLGLAWLAETKSLRTSITQQASSNSLPQGHGQTDFQVQGGPGPTCNASQTCLKAVNLQGPQSITTNPGMTGSAATLSWPGNFMLITARDCHAGPFV